MRTLFSFLLGIIFLSSGQAFAWTMNANFENGTIGQPAIGSSGFHEAGTLSTGSGSTVTFSTDRASTGSKSAKMSMTKGDGGTFGLLYYPSTVGNGTEVWARGYYYFASPWSWANASGGYRAIKLLRGIGTSNGFLSVFSDTNGVIQLSNEPGDEQTYTSPDSPGAPLYEKDKWQCIEMYVKLSATQGAFRIWKNGVLVQEDMNTKTLRNASDSATNAYFMSNWNDTVVQAQTMYMDDVVVTTDRPTKVDAKGNPMIGPISGPITTPVKPKAPTSLQVR